MTKTKVQWPAHALAKLASSGLSAAQASALGITFLSALQVKALHLGFQLADALHLAYVDPWTGAGFTDLPNRPPFYRLRYLYHDNGSAFGEKDRRQRYTNEPGFMVHAYFPTVPDFNWLVLLTDANEPLFITEGELKAAKACYEGFPTIGLGGVDSFSSKARGVELIPELEQVTWHKRRVYVVYDSDAEAKPEVRRAMNRLAKTLGQRGAQTFEVRLPAAEGEAKVGLDDYLVAHGREAFEALLTGTYAQGPELLARNGALYQLNEEVVYIISSNLFVHQRAHFLMKIEGFKNAYAPLPKVMQRTETPKGPGWKEVEATKAWLDWPERLQAGRLVYHPKPAHEPLVRFEPASDIINTGWNVWPGWGVKPDPNAHPDGVQPFLDMVEHVFTGAEPGVQEWFLRWLACPLQNPGVKMFSAVLLHGKNQGTGKSLMGHTMKRVYGENFTEIGNEELQSAFNAWAARKQFILGDEVAGSDKREFMDRLKRMITRPTVRVNEKNLPAFELDDLTNYLLTSNYGNALALSDTDRRVFVHHVTAPPLDEEAFMPYYLWLDTGGAACLFDYLLKLPLGDFNAQSKAPMTAAKAQLIDNSRSDLESWVKQLRDDPDAVLSSHPHFKVRGDLWTPAELLQAYDPDEKTRVKARGLGLALDGVLPKVNEGRQVRGPGGKQYYYAVRNVELWEVADVEAIKAHLQNLKAGPAAKVATVSSRKRKY